MTLKIETAVVLRAIRQLRAMSYDAMKDVSANSTISLLERAQTGITLSKLAEIAHALDFNLVTLITLCVGLQQGESPEAVLSAASEELKAFVGDGGQKLIEDQLGGKALVQRSRGKPSNKKNMADVLKLKAEGATQAEAMRRLNLPRSTVHKYWHQSEAPKA